MSDTTKNSPDSPAAAAKPSSVLSKLRLSQAGGEASTAAKAPKAEQPHPSGDNRFKMLDAALKRQRFSPDSLIEVLHTAQEIFGFLKTDVLVYIATALKLPPSRVYGVATFYHFFSFKPKGDHTCMICMGTACYVKGAEHVQLAVNQFARESTDCGTISVETARCVGACGLAPVVIFDGEVCGNLTPEMAQNRLKGWKKHGSQ
jgi:bidirectional [NiFe] hydrogenase diaphorase subunit